MGQLRIFTAAHTFPLYSPFMRSIKNDNLKAHFYEVIFSLGEESSTDPRKPEYRQGQGVLLKEIH